ncbi:ABC transporter ATP-binding protein, partial [Campylobacter coli]|nr:ABC transporter ATP-binding protein [Campylobacter coli]EAH5258113.1 ABC transporter ATP-binding protein [Campylobacter coli]EAJ0414514.1 ABC transporter ATP-binding protein [Campylobacter coli]EAL5753090.1 ABC transporter ATP-binding protein [Campylobacter coli]EHP1288810.1 ABC transporter ATP-binding protein [Campylobacter coli]
RKEFVFIRVECGGKILEFALESERFKQEKLSLYQELCLVFNEEAICFLN